MTARSLWMALLAAAFAASSCGAVSSQIRGDVPSRVDGDITTGRETRETPDELATRLDETIFPARVVDPGAIDVSIEPANGQTSNRHFSHIHVDQFGYYPSATKVAVISSPEIGFNDNLQFTPGNELEVRRVFDDLSVYASAPVPWNDGVIHDQSGDRGWWFDFSSVVEPGTYYIIDLDSDERSAPFTIGDDVYDDILDAAVKVFWFNRANTEHQEQFGGPWSDAAAFAGPNQDTEARSIDAPGDPTTARDLSGGWFDAGDTNKYVTFATEPVHQLLTAYDTHSALFDDSLDIPESGNGIPDILDEIAWEIAWLKKMQNPDGGVLTKVGLTDFSMASPPSSHQGTRYYEEVCSSSTVSVAGMFAHAALVFADVEALADEAEDLTDRAIMAWDWYQNNPLREDCDTLEIKAGDADLSIAEQARPKLSPPSISSHSPESPGSMMSSNAGTDP